MGKFSVRVVFAVFVLFRATFFSFITKVIFTTRSFASVVYSLVHERLFLALNIESCINEWYIITGLGCKYLGGKHYFKKS